MERVHTAELESPIGRLRLASTERGLLYLELPHANGCGLEGWLRRRVPGAVCGAGYAPNRRAIAQVLEYLEGKRCRFELPLDLRGTPFQVEVWRALQEIPYGETRSYGELARRLHRPRALRAVGAANGANPIALVVPCHRAVASGGKLGGYAGGLELKARLLELERRRPGQGRLL